MSPCDGVSASACFVTAVGGCELDRKGDFVTLFREIDWDIQATEKAFCLLLKYLVYKVRNHTRYFLQGTNTAFVQFVNMPQLNNYYTVGHLGKKKN